MVEWKDKIRFNSLVTEQKPAGPISTNEKGEGGKPDKTLQETRSNPKH